MLENGALHRARARLDVLSHTQNDPSSHSLCSSEARTFGRCSAAALGRCAGLGAEKPELAPTRVETGNDSRMPQLCTVRPCTSISRRPWSGCSRDASPPGRGAENVGAGPLDPALGRAGAFKQAFWARMELGSSLIHPQQSRSLGLPRHAAMTFRIEPPVGRS